MEPKRRDHQLQLFHCRKDLTLKTLHPFHPSASKTAGFPRTKHARNGQLSLSAQSTSTGPCCQVRSGLVPAPSGSVRTGRFRRTEMVYGVSVRCFRVQNQLKSMVSKGAFESVGIDSIQLGLRLLETLKLVSSSPAQGR